MLHYLGQLEGGKLNQEMLATRPGLVQRENRLDLVFTKLSENVLTLIEGHRLVIAIIYRLALFMCFSCPNPCENRNRNLWKGDFEGMKRHLHLQNWYTMLVGNIETKWLRFKTALLDLVEKFCPLAGSKRPLAKPWVSRHMVAMQKQKKKLYNNFEPTILKLYSHVKVPPRDSSTKPHRCC